MMALFNEPIEAEIYSTTEVVAKVLVLGIDGDRILCCSESGWLVYFSFGQVRLKFRYDEQVADWVDLSGAQPEQAPEEAT